MVLSSDFPLAPDNSNTLLSSTALECVPNPLYPAVPITVALSLSSTMHNSPGSFRPSGSNSQRQGNLPVVMLSVVL